MNVIKMKTFCMKLSFWVWLLTRDLLVPFGKVMFSCYFQFMWKQPMINYTRLFLQHQHLCVLCWHAITHNMSEQTVLKATCSIEQSRFQAPIWWIVPSCAWLPFNLLWSSLLSSWSCCTWTWSSSHLLLQTCSFCSSSYRTGEPLPQRKD